MDVILRQPAFVAADAVELLDGKTPPRQCALLKAVERHQFGQQLAIQDGPDDIGTRCGKEIASRIAYLLELKLRLGNPTCDSVALFARAFPRDHARQRFHLAGIAAITTDRPFQTMTQCIARCMRLAGVRLRARTHLSIRPIGKKPARADHAAPKDAAPAGATHWGAAPTGTAASVCTPGVRVSVFAKRLASSAVMSLNSASSTSLMARRSRFANRSRCRSISCRDVSRRRSAIMVMRSMHSKRSISAENVLA